MIREIMHIDFAIIDTDINEKQAKENCIQAIECGVNSITVPFYLLKTCKYLIEKTQTELSCFIDFPLGISDIKTRSYAVRQAIIYGANVIDISMPQNLAANRKYDKIRDDIKNIKDICSEKNIKIRYVLEYRLFDHRCLKKICEIFDVLDIQYAFPSTGFFIDNLADNLIAGSFLHQNSKEINIICSGNFWLEKHFNIVNKSGIYGLRCFCPKIICNFKQFLAKQKQGY